MNLFFRSHNPLAVCRRCGSAARFNLTIVLLLASLATFSQAADRGAPAARRYDLWVRETLNRVEADLPAISQAAAIAAERFIAGVDLGVRGGAGLNEELGARSGGLCVYRATRGKPGDLILYAFGVTTVRAPDAGALLARELDDAAALAAAGSTVIGIASFRQLETHGQLERARTVCRVLLDNHAPAGDGLFQNAAGQPDIPTFTTANAIVAWVWMSEFFADCTRQGKTPAMYQSILADPDRVRYAQYLKVRFHDDLQVAPIPVGQLGAAYLAVLRNHFDTVAREHWDALSAASQAMVRTLRDGGKVYIFARGHYTPYHHAGQLTVDPGLYTRFVMPRASAQTAPPALDPTDYAIAVGYSLPPGDPWWGGADDALRQAGRGVCWIISGYNTRQEHLRERELLLDQVWPHGDAALEIPGYDVNIIPPSGVMAEALMWMLTAQVWADTTGYTGMSLR